MVRSGPVAPSRRVAVSAPVRCRRRLPLVAAGAALGVAQAPEADQAERKEHDGQDDAAQGELLGAVVARLKRTTQCHQSSVECEETG